MDKVNVIKQETEDLIITVTTQLLDEPDSVVVRVSTQTLNKVTGKKDEESYRKTIKK